MPGSAAVSGQGPASGPERRKARFRRAFCFLLQ